MRKFVLILALFVLKVNCVDEDDWIQTLSVTEEPDPQISDFKSCGPNMRCVPPANCRNGKVNKHGHMLISPRSSVCDNIEECCLTEEVESEPLLSLPPTQLKCGYRNPDGIFLQLQSPENEAEFGEFPWMVAILVNRNSFHCGGSLIHPKVVLTAAHRMLGGPPSRFKVLAGEWDRNSVNEPLKHEERRVKKIVIHKDFVRRKYHNNVALLILKSAFDLSPHIATICLPPPSLNFDNTDCFVTGWGATEFRSKQYAHILKKIPLQVVPRATCEANIQKTKMGPKFRLEDSHLCAGGKNGEDACDGDGGSPLVCPIPNTTNRYYQVGVVSAGVECGQKDVPGIYADTGHILPWIQNEFRVKNLNLTFLP